MNTTLLDILKTHSSKDNEKDTNFTYYGPSQKINIKDTDWEQFWYKYCNLLETEVDSDKKNPLNLCLAEMPRRYMPVIVDFTLKFHVTDEDETYGTDFLMAVVYCYQQTLLDVLHISNDEQLICCVLEADECIEDSLIVSRFRLQFPYCKTLATIQNKIIRPHAIKMLRTQNILSRLNQTPISDWENIIDANTMTTPCLMYGSSKSQDIDPMMLQHIVEKVDIDDLMKTSILEIENVFRYEEHEHFGKNLVTKDLFDKDKNMKFWLPYFLSLDYHGRLAKPKLSKEESVNPIINSDSKSWSSNGSKSYDRQENEEENEQSMAEKFIPMLNHIDRQQECYWMDIGKALYNVFGGTQRGLDLWIQFTEKSDDYTAEDCRDQYYFFSGNKLTIKTLAWYARDDSIHEYENWHREWYLPYLHKATSTLDEDVAEAIYRVYWLDYASSTLNKKSMYHFDGHIWKRQQECYSLKIKISKDFVPKLEKLHTQISINVQESNDQNYKDMAQIQLKKLLNLINKLKGNTFKEKVLSEIQTKFYIENFENYLDSNDSTLGCLNGVIEASDKEAVMRPGKPEDYISKTTGLMYKEYKSMNDPSVQEVVKWFNQVFPDKELCKYASKLFASCIRGRNSEKIFAVLTGKGDNSKSMLKKAFECVFGSYCITFPTAIFTTKRNGTGPIPEIARSRAVRVAFVQEPDSDDSLRNGAIKEFTGGDRFFARMCNDNGGEIEAMFKLFLMCNHIPIIPHCDKAIKNRVRILPFLATWVRNAPKSEEERYKERLFQMDPRFESKIPKMAPAIMWYLVQHYNEYCRDGLREPPIIKQYTDEYWQNSDIYNQFIRENIELAYKDIPNWPEGTEKPLDTEQIVKVGDLYTSFKDWYKEFYPSQRCPERPIMIEEIDTRLKQKSLGKHWYGIKRKIELCSI